MKGAYFARHKDGSPYYRSLIVYRGTRVSLGSYPTEKEAGDAFLEAERIYGGNAVTIDNFPEMVSFLPLSRAVSIINHRDKGIYIHNPIYLRKDCLSYFLIGPWGIRELKFDTDDLFYYSAHQIHTREGGSLYVNDYGSQYRILSRYGVKNFAVEGRDFFFLNGDPDDYRSANIVVLSHYHGVVLIRKRGVPFFLSRIHLKGDWKIGLYKDEIEAAVSYNKAADLLREAGCRKDFPKNYVDGYSPKEYRALYDRITLPEKFVRMAEKR